MLKDLPILVTLPRMDLAALTCYEHRRRCLVNSRVATSFKHGTYLANLCIGHSWKTRRRCRRVCAIFQASCANFLLLYVQSAKHTLNNCGSKLQYE